MTCAIYCRLSKEDLGSGERESESIQNQKSMLVNHAVREGWEIFAIYSDEDYSGADRDRPEWNALLEAAKVGRFQVVLCKNQSRFTRDMEMVEKYIHGLFPLWGVRFVAVLDNIDTSQKGNKKARQINGLINEWYLEDLSENIRAVFQEKRRAGKYIGSFPPYGYRKDPADKGRLLVEEETAATVRRIYALYLGGMGIHRIAELLEGEGVPPPGAHRGGGAGGPWSHTAVSRILRGEVYTGTMVQGVKRKVSYKSKKLLPVPKEDWVRVENTHEAIIDRQTFETVRERLGLRTRSDGTGTVHPLAGKVRCGDCGSLMHRVTHKYKGVARSYLQCAKYARTRRNPACTGHTIRMDRLMEAVHTRLLGRIDKLCTAGDPGRFRFPGREGGDARATELRLVALRKREARYARALQTLYLDKTEGLITAGQFREMSASIAADRSGILAQLAALEARLPGEERTAAAVPPAAQVEALLRPPALDRALVDLVIERIEVGEKLPGGEGQAVKIFWRF